MEEVGNSSPERVKQVMLVDDEPAVCTTVKWMLERSGYTVADFLSGFEAVDIFTKNPEQYDAVVTDLTMPEITGLEVAKKIRSVRVDIPIILMSGFGLENEDKQKFEENISDFVVKPFSFTEFIETVKMALADE